MIVLGIETSCDETAAALVTDRRDILANLVHSQLADHAAYGGVVPEIAARAHLELLDGLIARTLADARIGFEDISAIAATAGPGLIGGVFVGSMTGKAIAAARDLPYIAVNHLEGHALTARLTDGIDFPYLLLLVSGGHCQLVAVEGLGRYRRLGGTIDDAVGEAFDKVAKLLGLGYPGGPEIERLAAEGDPDRFTFPRPLVGRAGCDFSFSGLKTAVRQAIETLGADGDIARQDAADLCAGFQTAVAAVLADRTANALAATAAAMPGAPLVVAGGVAANRALREALQAVAAAAGTTLVAPPPALCTDNAAMIAWAGMERLQAGVSDSLAFRARPRWPLDALDAVR